MKLKNITLIKGLIISLLGVILVLIPGRAIQALAIGFGALSILTGLVIVIFAFNKRTIPFYQFWFYEGLVDILIGLVFFLFPKVTIGIFLILLSIWILITGTAMLVAYFKNNLGTFSLVHSIITVLLGIIILFNPFEASAVVAFIIGILALAVGISTIINYKNFY